MLNPCRTDCCPRADRCSGGRHGKLWRLEPALNSGMHRVLRVAEDHLVNLSTCSTSVRRLGEEHVVVAAARMARVEHEGRGVDAVDRPILGHEFRRPVWAAGQQRKFVKTAAGTAPGHRIMAGTLMLPSNGVFGKLPRQRLALGFVLGVVPSGPPPAPPPQGIFEESPDQPTETDPWRGKLRKCRAILWRRKSRRSARTSWSS
jgi:hypothetical protein